MCNAFNFSLHSLFPASPLMNLMGKTGPGNVHIWDLSMSSVSRWRHQMETFSALLAICAGNSPVPGEFLAQWPVTRSFDVFFDLRLYKRLSKQSWDWWFEMPSCPLWRHRNVKNICNNMHVSHRINQNKTEILSLTNRNMISSDNRLPWKMAKLCKYLYTSYVYIIRYN